MARLFPQAQPDIHFRLDDLLMRRAKIERVTDLVNLDRVRGLLRTVYWRRRFLTSRDERRRILNAEAEGIPAIVLEPMLATPPQEERDPFDHTGDQTMSSASSPKSPGPGSMTPSSEYGSGPVHNRETSLGAIRHSPSLSVGSQPRASLRRHPSDSSMLSWEDAHNRR